MVRPELMTVCFHKISGRLLLTAWLLVSAAAAGQITFGNPMDYPVGTTPGAVVSGDFNSDHKLDLAVANSGSNDISILLGNGDGTFQPAVSYSVGLDPVSIAVADLNLDGKQDLAIAFYGDVASLQHGGVSILLGNGDGTFLPAPGLASSDYPTGIVPGDFNGDHKPDIAISNVDTGVSVFIGNGDSTFQAGRNYTVTGDALSISTGDFNEDSKQDLLVTTLYIPSIDEYGGKASVLLGRGDGTFQQASETELGGAAYIGAIGDFNGDKHLDLAFITKANVFSVPSIAVALGQGNGTFGTATLVDANNFDSFLTVDDINADGTPDLVALSYPVIPAGRVFVSNGDGTFHLAQTVVFGTFGPGAVAVGDFNGDQLHDLAVSVYPKNVVTVLLNTTTDFTVSASALTPPALSPGQSAKSTLTLTGGNGFAGSISLTCSVQPMPPLAPQCEISPTPVNSGTTATVTISTTGTQAKLISPRSLSWLYALWLPICGITLIGMVLAAGRDKRNLAKKGLWTSLIIALLLVNGCGGGTEQRQNNSGTPKGQYNIVVTATSGALRHPTTLVVTVQ